MEARPMSRHLVQFYGTAYPAQEASDFIAAGLQAGDTCIVLLVEPSRTAVEQQLERRRTFMTPGSQNSGHYLALDTHEVLARLMVDGRLDMERATESFGALMNPASHGGRGQVRVVGDPAPTLFAAGNEDDALRLEALVDGLSKTHATRVFCAYPMHDVHRHGSAHALHKMSAEHTSVKLPDQPWVEALAKPPQAGQAEQG
ncbi:MAG: hypothetical protein AD742_14630 [Methylibium sp. NZG]|nr:MAG: hypothetical protein AD742_14630 [Methylibium sp. NZG]